MEQYKQQGTNKIKLPLIRAVDKTTMNLRWRTTDLLLLPAQLVIRKTPRVVDGNGGRRGGILRKRERSVYNIGSGMS